MTDKELKHLKRVDLLELLIAQIRENDRLKAELDSALSQLEERNLVLEEAGSIAEAALRINKVYEAVQDSVDQYITSISRLGTKKQRSWERMEQKAKDTADRHLLEAQTKCRVMEDDARWKCEAMLSEAQRTVQLVQDRCRSMEAETRRKCEAMLAQAQTLPEQNAAMQDAPQQEEAQSKAPTGGKKSDAKKE